MRTTINIIIPYYEEPEYLIQFAVHSVAMQLGVNFDDVTVTLVNDGKPEYAISEDFFKRWPMLTHTKSMILKENVGPGLARQAALDESTADYVMFLDADDRWNSCKFLSDVIAATADQPDIIISRFIVDDSGDKGFRGHFLDEGLKPNDFTWLHAKAYRRGFLQEVGLRFHPKLRMHEDEFFQQCASRTAKKVAYLQDVNMIWVNNPLSLTRHDNRMFHYTTSKSFIQSHVYVCEWLEERGYNSGPLATDMVTCCYVFFKQRIFDNLQYYVAKCEELITRELGAYWEKTRLKAIEAEEGYYSVKLNCYKARFWNHGELEDETFPAWLNRLGLAPISVPKKIETAIGAETKTE